VTIEHKHYQQSLVTSRQTASTCAKYYT